MNTQSAVIDLQKLQQEVLSRGPEAALPCNLSDCWLDQVSASLDQILASGDDESSKHMSGPLALIFHVLLGKNNNSQLEVGGEEIFNYFKDYRLELALEEVNRRTDIKGTSATLSTIFTDRNVEFERGNILIGETKWNSPLNTLKRKM